MEGCRRCALCGNTRDLYQLAGGFVEIRNGIDQWIFRFKKLSEFFAFKEIIGWKRRLRWIKKFNVFSQTFWNASIRKSLIQQIPQITFFLYFLSLKFELNLFIYSELHIMCRILFSNDRHQRSTWANLVQYNNHRLNNFLFSEFSFGNVHNIYNMRSVYLKHKVYSIHAGSLLRAGNIVSLLRKFMQVTGWTMSALCRPCSSNIPCTQTQTPFEIWHYSIHVRLMKTV